MLVVLMGTPAGSSTTLASRAGMTCSFCLVMSMIHFVRLTTNYRFGRGSWMSASSIILCCWAYCVVEKVRYIFWIHKVCTNVTKKISIIFKHLNSLFHPEWAELWNWAIRFKKIEWSKRCVGTNEGISLCLCEELIQILYK